MTFMIKQLSWVLIFITPVVQALTPGWKSYLEQGEINAMVEQGDSLVWLGTPGGLVKINRHSNDTTFYNKNNSGIPDNYVRCLALDSTGSLWMTSVQKHLTRFCGGVWTVIPLDTSRSLFQGYIRDLAIDRRNKVYVATADGFYTYDTVVTHYDHEDFGQLDGGGAVTCITIAPDTTVWMGTLDGALHIVDTTWTFYTPDNSDIPSNYVEAICFDKKGDIWMATTEDSYIVNKGGLVRFDGSDWTVYNVDSIFKNDITFSPIDGNSVYDLVIDNNEVKWFILDNGRIASFDGANWKVYQDSIYQQVSNVIKFAGVGSDNTIWIKADRSSFKFQSGSVQRVAISSSGLPPSGGAVNAITVDRDGHWWIGTTKAGLARFDGKSWTIWDTLNSGLPCNKITLLTADTGNGLWIGTTKGVTRKNGDTWETWDSAGGDIPTDSITAMAIDKAGKVWAGTENSGLFSFDGKTWKRNSSLGYNQITCLSASSDGSLWVGTYSSGVYRLKGSSYEKFTSSNSGLESNHVTAIFEQHDGKNTVVYATLSAWTYFYVNGEWHCTTSLGAQGVTGFTSSLDGRTVWAVANEFIYKVHYDTTSNLINGGTFFSNLNSGLSSQDITALATDSSGNILFGDGGQLDVFLNDLAGLRHLPKAAPVMFQMLNVRYHSRPATIIGTFTLAEPTRVQISILTLTGKEVIRSAGRLFTSGTHELTFPASGLAPGNYLWRQCASKKTITRKVVVF